MQRKPITLEQTTIPKGLEEPLDEDHLLHERLLKAPLKIT
jgi:hypothetical protein